MAYTVGAITGSFIS
jgi:hypothetical protein